MKVVVCTSISVMRGGRCMLPPSVVTRGEAYCGGVRSLHELAFAAATAGYDVELRGSVDASMLEDMKAATGIEPRTNLPARHPDADDIVIIPEGESNIRDFAYTMLAPARLVMFILAPPGFCGWSFEPDWQAVDPLSVPIEELGRPEPFRAISECGFHLWSNSTGISQSAAEAGVKCTDIGMGWPAGVPESPEKNLDVVYLKHNRWAPLTEQVVEKLDVEVYGIPKLPHAELMRELGRGRIMLWPSRVEGIARIQCEARSMGTVPVALESNVYAAGMNYESGAVVVPDLDAMEEAVRRLLSNRDELDELSRHAVNSMRQQSDWNNYAERVGRALSDIESPSVGGKMKVG